jgi:hypothetical protein
MTNTEPTPSVLDPATPTAPPDAAIPALDAAVVRYRVKPGRAAENAELVAAVCAEMHALAPEGFRYATFVLEDGLSFVHIAISSGGEISPVLRRLPAFVRFRDTLEERCDEPPVATRMTAPVGSYGF